MSSPTLTETSNIQNESKPESLPTLAAKPNIVTKPENIKSLSTLTETSNV